MFWYGMLFNYLVLILQYFVFAKLCDSPVKALFGSHCRREHVQADRAGQFRL